MTDPTAEQQEQRLAELEEKFIADRRGAIGEHISIEELRELSRLYLNRGWPFRAAEILAHAEAREEREGGG